MRPFHGIWVLALVACGASAEVAPAPRATPEAVEPATPSPFTARAPAPGAEAAVEEGPSACGPIDRSELDEDPGLFEGSPEDAEPDADDDTPSRARRCAEGCVLVGPNGEIAVTVYPDVEESGIPQEVLVVRFDAAGVRTETHLATEGYDADRIFAWLEEGEDPPWTAAVRRALRGTDRWTLVSSVATGGAATFDFSLTSVVAVRGLSGPLEGSLLFAEQAPDAVRLHLVRRDDCSSRLVGTTLLDPGSCDGDGIDTSCITPAGIGSVYVANETTGVVILDVVPAGHGGTYREVVRLALDGLPSSDAVPSAELVASLEAPGRRPRWLGPWVWRDEPDEPVVGPPPLENGALTSRCDWECVFFGRATVIVRPTVVVGMGGPEALLVTRGDEETRVPITDELDWEADEMPWHAATVEAIGSLVGLEPATDLVAREAIANDDGWLVTPLVELRAPLAGTRLFVETTESGYVVRRIAGGATSALGEPLPLLHVEGGVVPRAGIARVYLSPDGHALVVLLYARLGEGRTELFTLRARI